MIEKIIDKVRTTFFGEHTGHDWHHAWRVYQNSKLIARMEDKQVDLFLLELTALMHDVGDHKFFPNEKDAYKRLIPEFLQEFGLDDLMVDKVIKNVGEISFKGKGVETKTNSIESAIVQDADRLDAIGAIGVARTFAFGGAHKRQIFDPEQHPENHDSFEEYKTSKGHTINHFYEKLLLLKDRMQTASGRKLAEERHLFMEAFLKQFYKEWYVNED